MMDIKLRTEHLRNSGLAGMDKLLPEIERVFAALPRETHDEMLVALCVSFVAGLLYERMAEANALEQDSD